MDWEADCLRAVDVSLCVFEKKISLLWICLLSFQYVQYGDSGVQRIATICAEIVEQWSSLSVYFGCNRSSGTSEVRVTSPIETQVFDYALVRPRFAVLRFILDCVERESAALVHSLAALVYPASSHLASYDLSALLQPMSSELESVNHELYKVHFGQYIRFYVSGQLPYFYPVMQKLLSSVCQELATKFRQD